MTETQLILQPESVYAQAISELATMLDSIDGSLDLPPEIADAAAVGIGWWVRIVRTADAIRRLHRAGLSNEASPLVRTVLLHWVALAWLCQHPDEAFEAVDFENKRWKQKFVNRVAKSSWKLKKVKLGPPPKDAPAGVKFLDDVGDMCERAGTRDTYLPYMLESPKSHPSMISAAPYAQKIKGRVELRGKAVVPGVSLRVVANAAAIATKLVGELVGDAAMIAKAEAVAATAHLPLAFGDAAPAPVDPDA